MGKVDLSAPRGRDVADQRLWEGVGELVDRARSHSDLRAHRLEALAAWCWRGQGRPVPTDFAEQARSASLASLLAPLLLANVRAACDGPIVVLKGPEVAAHYPHPSMRPFRDLDLLVPNAADVQGSLRAAGFVPVGDETIYRDIHHLRPLHLDGFPLVVEIHSRPKWPERIPLVNGDELLDAAVASLLPIDGILALPSAHHALLLAAHGWSHAPFARLFHLIDVAVVRRGAVPREIEALAARWGLSRLWRTTSATVDALLYEGHRTWPLRSWARHLSDVREQTVLETHASSWLAGFSALPPLPAVRCGLEALAQDLRPVGGETWSDKWFRSRRAVANAFVARSEHEAEVEAELRERRSSPGAAGRERHFEERETR